MKNSIEELYRAWLQDPGDINRFMALKRRIIRQKFPLDHLPEFTKNADGAQILDILEQQMNCCDFYYYNQQAFILNKKDKLKPLLDLQDMFIGEVLNFMIGSFGIPIGEDLFSSQAFNEIVLNSDHIQRNKKIKLPLILTMARGSINNEVCEVNILYKTYDESLYRATPVAVIAIVDNNYYYRNYDDGSLTGIVLDTLDSYKTDINKLVPGQPYSTSDLIEFSSAYRDVGAPGNDDDYEFEWEEEDEPGAGWDEW